MEFSDQEKISLANEAFRSFFSQFGANDIYLSVFLEVLLEELRKPEMHHNTNLWIDVNLQDNL